MTSQRRMTSAHGAAGVCPLPSERRLPRLSDRTWWRCNAHGASLDARTRSEGGLRVEVSFPRRTPPSLSLAVRPNLSPPTAALRPSKSDMRAKGNELIAH